MISARFGVVLDACVLYPMHLRDVLLQSFSEGLYQGFWSAEILDEATRNLVANTQITSSQAAHLISEMSRHFPEAMVTDYGSLIPAMENDEKDRHVAAAAVKSGAQVIVTANVRDFRRLPSGIEAQTPDEFLSHLFDMNPDRMMVALEKVCARRKRPPREVAALVAATLCPGFESLVCERIADAVLDAHG